MLNYILYALLVWFLYKLIFHFIIPVYRTTKQVKEKFSQMHQNMQEQMNPRQETSTQPNSSKKPRSTGDYIDFEEVK
jgi:hypothetical protein